MKVKIFFILLVSIITVSFFSCEDNISDVKDIVFPESEVSFSRHVFPLMQYNCSINSCHGLMPGLQASQMVDYQSIRFNANAGFVIPENPDGSLIIQIIERTFDPHIVTGYINFKINSNQKAGMRTWIEEGAENVY